MWRWKTKLIEKLTVTQTVILSLVILFVGTFLIGYFC